MSNDVEIASIETSIKEANKIKDLGSALERLTLNRDFQAVIKQGYFKDEAVRLVHLRGDPNFQTDERQAGIIKQLDGIAALSQYFSMLSLTANQATKVIEDGEAVLADLRNGGAE